jgi:hypothetical protein
MFEFFRNLEETLARIKTGERESDDGIIFDGIKRIIKNFGEIFFPAKRS